MYIVENNVNLIFELRKNRWVSLWNFLTWHISASLLLKANLLISPYFLCWYETTDMFLNICFTIEVLNTIGIPITLHCKIVEVLLFYKLPVALLSLRRLCDKMQIFDLRKIGCLNTKINQLEYVSKFSSKL